MVCISINTNKNDNVLRNIALKKFEVKNWRMRFVFSWNEVLKIDLILIYIPCSVAIDTQNIPAAENIMMKYWTKDASKLSSVYSNCDYSGTAAKRLLIST